MNGLRAVLDANVYVSAFLRPEGPPGRIVERFLRGGALVIVLTPATAEEVLRALAYPKVQRLARKGVDPQDWFEDVMALADFVQCERVVSGVCADADDDKYLAAAIEGRAGFLVTGDQELLSLGEYEGIRVVTPRAFLDLLEPE